MLRGGCPPRAKIGGQPQSALRESLATDPLLPRGRPKRYPLSPPGFSIRIRRASREGAVAFSTYLWGWVSFMLCDLPFGEILDIPFQQTKAVAENCSDVAAFPPLKHLCVLCGSPPHPVPETFRCRPRGFRTASISRPQPKLHPPWTSALGPFPPRLPL